MYKHYYILIKSVSCFTLMLLNILIIFLSNHSSSWIGNTKKYWIWKFVTETTNCYTPYVWWIRSLWSSGFWGQSWIKKNSYKKLRNVISAVAVLQFYVHTFQWSLINSFNRYFDSKIQPVPLQGLPPFTLSLSQLRSSSHLEIWQS